MLIYSNYKLYNNNGINYEIDIFIVIKINDFEVNIAIEFKDFKSKVSEDKIEVFNSKCLRLPQISKMNFVTTSGYHEGVLFNRIFEYFLFIHKAGATSRSYWFNEVWVYILPNRSIQTKVKYTKRYLHAKNNLKNLFFTQFMLAVGFIIVLCVSQ